MMVRLLLEWLPFTPNETVSKFLLKGLNPLRDLRAHFLLFFSHDALALRFTKDAFAYISKEGICFQTCLPFKTS